MLEVIGQVDPVAMPPSPDSSSMGDGTYGATFRLCTLPDSHPHPARSGLPRTGRARHPTSPAHLTALPFRQALDVVDEVPDVLFGNLAIVGLHVSRHAVPDDQEDLTVACAVLPHRIGEVGRHATGV